MIERSGSNSGRRIFFSGVNFECWLRFWYVFHPGVTAVACKSSSYFAKSTGGRLQLNTHAPYVCGFAWWGDVTWCLIVKVHHFSGYSKMCSKKSSQQTETWLRQMKMAAWIGKWHCRSIQFWKRNALQGRAVSGFEGLHQGGSHHLW